MTYNNTPENLLLLLKELKQIQPFESSILKLFMPRGFDPRWSQSLVTILKREKIIKNSKGGAAASYTYISAVEPNIEMCKKAFEEASKLMKEKSKRSNEQQKLKKQQFSEGDSVKSTHKERIVEPEPKWKAGMERNVEGKLVPKCEVYPITCQIERLIEVNTEIAGDLPLSEILISPDRYILFNTEFLKRINHPDDVVIDIRVKEFKGLKITCLNDLQFPIMVK